MPLWPSAQDELLRLTGSTNTIFETIVTTANGTGASYTDIGVAFPQQTTTMAVATGSLATQFPVVSVRTKPARPYLRVVKTTTGTSPSFASVGVFLVADPGGVA
jgi:uncharacterized membrane protein (UPF0182 family)